MSQNNTHASYLETIDISTEQLRFDNEIKKIRRVGSSKVDATQST